MGYLMIFYMIFCFFRSDWNSAIKEVEKDEIEWTKKMKHYVDD
jgi:hypothetical protein